MERHTRSSWNAENGAVMLIRGPREGSQRRRHPGRDGKDEQGLDEMRSGKGHDRWMLQGEQNLGGGKVQGQVQAAEWAWEL